MAALGTTLFCCCAAQAAGCKGAGSHNAKPLVFDNADYETRQGMFLTIQLGFLTPPYPPTDIAKQINPCKRRDFKVGGKEYTLYGDDGPHTVRWAIQRSVPDQPIYLVLMPRPVWLWQKYGRDINAQGRITFDTATQGMWALTQTVGGVHRFYRFYDLKPDDPMLVEDICRTVSGELPVLASYDTPSIDTTGLSAQPRSDSGCMAVY